MFKVKRKTHHIEDWDGRNANTGKPPIQFAQSQGFENGYSRTKRLILNIGRRTYQVVWYRDV